MPQYRVMEDMNVDGRDDIVAFAQDGVYVALSQGENFASPRRWVNNFGSDNGWRTQEEFPRILADVNGDKFPDIVGFGGSRVYVSLSENGASLSSPKSWQTNFTRSQGWSTLDAYPRLLEDVNGDGLSDIVGFGGSRTYVSFSTGTGFKSPTTGSWNFSQRQGWRSQEEFPRFLADVNGDALPDLVGFGAHGAYVSENTGASFTPPVRWVGQFGTNHGWDNQDTMPRFLQDMNDDGRADIVGFDHEGVLVSTSTGSGFTSPQYWSQDFGLNDGWDNQDATPRSLADVNGDGLFDVVGFSGDGPHVAASFGSGLRTAEYWIDNFAQSDNWNSQDKNPRMMSDINADGLADIVGFGGSATYVLVSGAVPVLNSFTEGEVTILLDFDGNEAGTQKGHRANAVTPMFSLDDTGFLDLEDRNAIEEIFARVAEDFAPFDVNVTTVDPGQKAFDEAKALRVAIGGHVNEWYNPKKQDSDWGSGSSGGQINGERPQLQDERNRRLVWVWPDSIHDQESGPDGFAFDRIAAIANTASHEAGHALGLFHHNDIQIGSTFYK